MFFRSLCSACTNSSSIGTYHVISYCIVAYRFVSYHIIKISSYPILSSPMSYYIIPYYTLPYNIIISYHITSHHITSHHIISYHIIYYIISTNPDHFSPFLGEHHDSPGLVHVFTNQAFSQGTVQARHLNLVKARVCPVQIASNPINCQAVWSHQARRYDVTDVWDEEIFVYLLYVTLE